MLKGLVAPLTNESAVEIVAEQLENGLSDYFRFVDTGKDYEGQVTAEDFSDAFYNVAIREWWYAKYMLREMMRKSSHWNEEYQAWVFQAQRSAEPNKDYVLRKAREILKPALTAEEYFDGSGYLLHTAKYYDIRDAIYYFAYPNDEYYQQTVKKLAPNANLRRKKSKIFGELCKALGVWQDSGRDFQMAYSDLCNEFNIKKVDFKLYVSIHPLYFLTASNPQNDTRGETMQSCHSLTYDDTVHGHATKTGTIGYALDGVTMVAFTVSNDDDPQTLNNRKVTRQYFHYKDGVLLQNRLYKTFGSDSTSYGGTYEYNEIELEICKIYRELIQKEICKCENVPNFWGKPTKYSCSNLNFPAHPGFSGYKDWEQFDNLAIVSIRKDVEETAEGFKIGEAPICIECGEKHGGFDLNMKCRRCQNHCHDCGNSGDLYTVYDYDHNEIEVCENCRDNYYFYCQDCEEYHHIDNQRVVGYEYDRYFVCDRCYANYDYCPDCNCDLPSNDFYMVHNADGEEIWVCYNCRENNYTRCECGEYYPNEVMEENGGVCPECAKKAKKNNVA